MGFHIHSASVQDSTAAGTQLGHINPRSGKASSKHVAWKIMVRLLLSCQLIGHKKADGLGSYDVINGV